MGTTFLVTVFILAELGASLTIEKGQRDWENGTLCKKVLQFKSLVV